MKTVRETKKESEALAKHFGGLQLPLISSLFWFRWLSKWRNLFSFSSPVLLVLRWLRAISSCQAWRWRPIFGAKLEAWSHEMFHIFHFLQSDMVFGIANPFLWIFNVISNEENLHSRLESNVFFRLLNPDWSFKISGEPAVYKACLKELKRDYLR